MERQYLLIVENQSIWCRRIYENNNVTEIDEKPKIQIKLCCYRFIFHDSRQRKSKTTNPSFEELEINISIIVFKRKELKAETLGRGSIGYWYPLDLLEASHFISLLKTTGI